MKISTKLTVFFFIILTLFSGCKKEELIVHNLTISSPAFRHLTPIPDKYSCYGEEINPAILIEKLPDNAKNIVLILEDYDSDVGTWVHWLVWNIPATDRIEEDSIPGIQGLNSIGQYNYTGPCKYSDMHRYIFTVYAIDNSLDIQDNSRLENVLNEIENHIVGKGEIIGLYGKSNRQENVNLD